MLLYIFARVSADKDGKIKRSRRMPYGRSRWLDEAVHYCAGLLCSFLAKLNNWRVDEEWCAHSDSDTAFPWLELAISIGHPLPRLPPLRHGDGGAQPQAPNLQYVPCSVEPHCCCGLPRREQVVTCFVTATWIDSGLNILCHVKQNVMLTVVKLNWFIVCCWPLLGTGNQYQSNLM